MNCNFVGAILVLSLTGIVQAQPAISNLKADNISHSSVRLSWTSTVPVNRQIAFDTQQHWNIARVYRYKTSFLNDFETVQSMNVTGLQPGTQYVACPLAQDATGHGLQCVNGDPQIAFTTTAAPLVHP